MGTREEIVAAAARIMRRDGYARATTKAIALEAGYSEAALYKHFPGKVEIFLSVLAEQTPGLDLIRGVAGRAGQGSVRTNLEELAATAIAFYTETFPVAMSLYSTQTLLAAHRDRVHELGVGPHLPLDGLADYLYAERELGRIDRDADPAAMASLLIGACFHHAFLATFAGTPVPDGERDRLAGRLVAALLGPG